MKRWRIVVIVLAACFGLIALAKPYVEARLSLYHLGGRLDGRNILLTCLSKDPTLIYGGASWDDTYRKPPLADLEVFLACKTADAYKGQLVADTSGLYGDNQILDDTVNQYTWCVHPSFSEEQVELCKQTAFDAVDWMIENGTPLSTTNSCGYLHNAAHEMNEDMFNFLLSRGADPEQLCPPELAAFGVGVDRLIDTNSRTVAELLTVLLSEYTEEEKSTIVADWVRMLSTIKPSKE